LAVSGGPQRQVDDWVDRKQPGSPAAVAAQSAKTARQEADQ
jgi:bifunctional UDP-N-acetylglucosamine pyrophosphorylase/glucosamine-1-phosphate N-acetyltransferase